MIFFVLLGLAVGSFVNVVIFRTIHNKSIVTPRSHCLKCNKTLKIFHLIPLISFVFLKGKCFFCKEKISFIYPLNEFFCACLFILAFLLYGDDFFKVLIFSLILSIFLILSLMDYYLKAVSEIWLWILFILAFIFDFISNENLNILNLEESFVF
ncbi:prepilin peptidase, partial [Campylobacter sp.]|uniref:prepilin peptidase n=1 Tax=Campylobacter sp. TaxID=205 RepID=UPI0025C45319